MLSRIVRGALAGLIATAPMTVVMEVWHRFLPGWQQGPLPPSEITEEVEEETLQHRLLPKEHLALTMVNHFLYGAACGAIYAPFGRLRSVPGPIGGMVFGVLVWVVSYLGWLPALGIMRPATEHPAQRNALMIGAHLVWGATAGLIIDRLERDGDS